MNVLRRISRLWPAFLAVFIIAGLIHQSLSPTTWPTTLIKVVCAVVVIGIGVLFVFTNGVFYYLFKKEMDEETEAYDPESY
jgi:peptidoglycan/LPS O-acetylase OafA/YrhL